MCAEVYITHRPGRLGWTIWASTVPSGGTRVDTWVRWTKASAIRKARKVAAREERNARPELRIDVQCD